MGKVTDSEELFPVMRLFSQLMFLKILWQLDLLLALAGYCCPIWWEQMFTSPEEKLA